MITIPDSHVDLLNGQVGALSTIGPTGHPQVTAVVAKLMDDGLLHTSTNNVRQKYKNLTDRPQATYFVIDPNVPYRTLEIRADIEVLDDPGKVWSRTFLGDGVDVDQIDPPGAERIHVVLRPTKVNTLGSAPS